MSARSVRPPDPRSSISAAQAFLGVRIGCAECHNHPLETLHAGRLLPLRRLLLAVHLDRKESGKGATVLSVAGPDGKPTKADAGVVQPRTGQFLKPQPLDRSPTSVGPDEDHASSWRRG